MANCRSDHMRTIRKSWHRVGMYLWKEWRHISRKVHVGRGFHYCAFSVWLQHGHMGPSWSCFIDSTSSPDLREFLRPSRRWPECMSWLTDLCHRGFIVITNHLLSSWFRWPVREGGAALLWFSFWSFWSRLCLRCLPHQFSVRRPLVTFGSPSIFGGWCFRSPYWMAFLSGFSRQTKW